MQVFPDRGCKREIGLLKKKCKCGELITISDYKVIKLTQYVDTLYLYIINKTMAAILNWDPSDA